MKKCRTQSTSNSQETWRSMILREFTPQVARLTLVADPDGLLLEEGVFAGIRQRGFELIPFDDHVAFRYAYESRFRARWDRGEDTDLVVVLRSPASDLSTLPYDLLQAGRKLSFSLGDLFPNLSYPVIEALDRADLDALFVAQARHEPGRLGDNATKEFVLRHVFEIAPELIKQSSDLLRVLLRRHYRGQRIPAILDAHFIQVLRRSGMFDEWPLAEIIPDAQAFFFFLQERWPIFLDHKAAQQTDAAHEVDETDGLRYPGPPLLPFDHDDIRVYIDNLFLEGMLQPVDHDNAEVLAQDWAACGIKISPEEQRLRRIDGLLTALEDSLPSAESRHGEWLAYASRFARLTALQFASELPLPPEHEERLAALAQKTDDLFAAWLQQRYAWLSNLPAMPPVMLHHVPRFLAHHLEEAEQAKIALLLVDGLALNQWLVLRDVLGEEDPRLRFHDQGVFAWIPTITSVSRQATFAGKIPFLFDDSIDTTAKEERLWQRFWQEQGLHPYEVAYARGLGDGDLDRIIELLEQPKLRVIGLIVDKVDRIMHGMELGAAGMHNQIRQWAKQGYLRDLIGRLHDAGFHVTLTSDHGNVEAVGMGRPAEGVIADQRGERVRIYSDQLLREQVREKFPDALVWSATGLPDDYLPLIAPGRKAFVKEGKSLVAHGGISIEEVIVPLVRIERATS